MLSKKKDDGNIEYIYSFFILFVVCTCTVLLIKTSAYNMRKEQIENFITDSTLAGAVIDISNFQLTGEINNNDIKKTYNNYIECLSKNLNLRNSTKINDVVLYLQGPKKDIVISDDEKAIKITDYYLYNSKYNNQEEDTGTFYVTKLINNSNVNNNPEKIVYSTDLKNTNVILSENTNKKKEIKLKKNTMAIYVKLEIKIKPLKLFVWNKSYESNPIISTQEYLVDVTNNGVYRVE